MGRAHEVRKAAMAKTAARKSKEYAKYGVLIYRAAKSGMADPDLNQTLKKEVERAKKAQIPADVIKRAIEKAKGSSGDDYQSISYEAFGPGNSLIIVECLSDNANRTNTEVRTAITRNGGKMGVTGSVSYMFSNEAIFSFEGMTDEAVLEILMEADCDVRDIEHDDGLISVYAPSNEYGKIRDTLSEFNPDIDFLEDEIGWIPSMKITIKNPEDKKLLLKMISILDDIDDVQQVFHNVADLEE